VTQFTKRADRVVCWDAVKPKSYKTLEFHRV
jgi:hypothetical protein